VQRTVCGSAEPPVGSVAPSEPMASPLASGASTSRFTSSLPKVASAGHSVLDCTIRLTAGLAARWRISSSTCATAYE
jgi:hypothetical protein